ncbi:hypothetical protein [Geothrix fuzhouensis]|uniref:hypothetical protein n=1 Tax=Geothrix fuzhouensis TaxID=2966451 RepID=UPI002147FE8F|nr:hypothetical protein [Geothrix fuzhouensis]
MPETQQTLVRFVERRAHLSLHLIGSLRSALQDLDRPDLLPLLDLISRNVGEAHEACLASIDAIRYARRKRIQVSLAHLITLGGPKAKPLARSLTEDLSRRSGAFQAFQ